MVRAHIRFTYTKDVVDFIQNLNSDGTAEKYFIENAEGNVKIEARSLLGVMYMMSDHNEDCYLVNNTVDGKFPSFIDKYRV